ncbi:MAG: hypothetical protein KDM64_01585 [Verrucomicrobiae bacterium]|nr:hypothetical protein [Verrucomicrobiae bacterium]
MPALTPRSTGRRTVRFLLVATIALLIVFLLAIVLFTSAESRALGSMVNRWARSMDAGATAEVHLSVESAEGLPKELVGNAVTLQCRAPDRLRLEATIQGEPILAGRNGDEVWIHVEKKAFTVIGDNRTPKFSSDPDSVEPVTLPDFKLPLSANQCRLIPFLVKVRSVGNAASREISPSWIGKHWAGLPDFLIRFSPRPEGENHQTVTARLPDGKSLTLAIDHFRIGQGIIDDTAWEPPKNATSPAERVALSHLKRCAEILVSQLGAKTPTLPPVMGKQELIATSGRGRLDDHDGVRVLFLSGTPEEMGRQHGELMKKEVRSVVDRIVYGIGVGSSFAKGRWFFGEIEEAQHRIEPFIPESHLREMDAIADASGLHPQEARLANFFPELFHCTGFALHGTATSDGQMYHGRILDYIRGAGLEDNAVVMVNQPEGKNAWVNISYAGFVGSVTAMNEKHLAIGEMGGRGEGNWDGKPMAQLVREVMETCDTVDEAVSLMRQGPRTCEYYYVISDAKSMRAVGIKATPDTFETVWSGESHPQLPTPVPDTVLMSAGDRYTELVRRVKEGFGKFDADASRNLMTRPVCMKSNIQSVLFAPGSLDFWVANADSENVASHTRYTRFNLGDLLRGGGS